MEENQKGGDKNMPVHKPKTEWVRVPGGPVRIDLKRLPAHEGERLGRTLLAQVKDFYKDPENCRQRDTWLAQGGGETK